MTKEEKAFLEEAQGFRSGMTIQDLIADAYTRDVYLNGREKKESRRKRRESKREEWERNNNV